jgi:antitoxin component YwqK of YwqJK toxin-antitoxin module
MKKYLAFSTLILALALFSCGPKKVVESKYENGNPKVVKYYSKVNGKEQVVKEEVYYENKVKKMEGEYINEQRTGHWSAWYQNGQLWSTGEYKDGKRNGPGMVYHENGTKYIESVYANDDKAGKWRFYDSTGKVVKEVDFDLLKQKINNDSIK